MVHFEQHGPIIWFAKDGEETLGTILKVDHGYHAAHADGYDWTYDTLDAAQDSFLEPDKQRSN